MPSTVPPETSKIPVVEEDVVLHIWGETSDEGLAYARRLLRSDAERFNMPGLVAAAMTPGGVRIRNYPFKRGDRAYPLVLNDGGFSKVGLSMAWLTAPVGDTLRGSHLTHAGQAVHLHVRCNPARAEHCDLVRSLKGECPDMTRTASALLRLAPLLGVRGMMSAHDEIKCTRALRMACQARSAEDLESALAEALKRR